MNSNEQEIAEVFILLDHHNQIIGVSSLGKKLLKIDPADLLGKSVDVLIPEQSSSISREEILEDGRKEVSLKLKKGKSVFAELTVVSIIGVNGTPNGRALTIRDNTKSRERTKRLRQGEKFRQQNAILRALNDTTIDLHSSLNLDIVLKNIVSRACSLFDTSHGFLDILKESGELEPTIGVGVLEKALKHKVVRGEGVAGTIWESGSPLVLNEYDKWQGKVQRFHQSEIRAIMGMPMRLGEKIVGVIGVAREKESEDTFSEDDVSLLNRFADLAVVALQNARLFKDAQQELEMRRSTENELRNTNQILQLQIEQVELLQKQLEEWAVRDPLTELYNRRYFKEALDLGIADAEGSDRSLALLMIDCDQLKTVNDKFGHKAGDDILLLITSLINDNIRSGDVACRYGGDEFVILVGNVTSKTALERANHLRKVIGQRTITYRKEHVNVSISVGIAMYPEHGKSGDGLLQKADHALYEAKRMGKNRAVLFSEKQAAQ